MDKITEIVSSETIKPSSPTPETLRIFKLSLFDQIGITYHYVSIIFFYANSDGENPSNRLKNSLSHALNYDCMYPLAGRLKDGFSIDCNDQGALFIEARVSDNISSVLENPKLNFLQQLLPPDPIETTENPSERVLLAVQFNHFLCGGTAIGVSVSHAIADASAVASFVTNWAALAREETINLEGFVLDCTKIFPPIKFDFLAVPPKKTAASDTKANRFVFDGSKIALLREKARERESHPTPTRFEAISAFIWGAIITTIREKGKFDPFQAHITCIWVNLRTRMVPQLPRHCLGSISHGAVAVWTAAEDPSTEVLVGKVHESSRKLNESKVKSLHASDEYFNGFKRAAEEFSIGTNAGLLLVSSWCRFPFYEADFGWEKPVWVSVGDVESDNVVLMDACDGEGIEAWVRLSKDDMATLEQNHGFLSYVSSTQSV